MRAYKASPRPYRRRCTDWFLFFFLAFLVLNLASCGGGSATNSTDPVAPTITTQPADQTVTEGQSATFIGVADGTPPLNYQWQSNGTAISGATSASYTTSATTSADDGSQLALVVSNSVGSVSSKAATLHVNPGPPSITAQPASQTVTVSQTATFTVVAGGTSPLTYQWQKNGVAVSGATSASYITPPTILTDSGSQFAVVVSNASGSVTSHTATLTVNASTGTPASVLTYHNDNERSGQNVSETILTPQNVNTATFGKLFSVPIDGLAYAQPLYVPNVTIPGLGTHNVVYVATEHDSVYAFDADQSGPPLWQESFIDPPHGITTLSAADVSCNDLVPEIGITGTPVIDTASGTLYLVARTKENGAFVQRLHALDVGTGAEKFGGPVIIQATVNGTGAGSVNSKVSFNAQSENQRSALLLQNGLVYVAWASLCDVDPYHGWLIAYDAQNLDQAAVWNATANGARGGIWGSGAGPASDGSSVLFATGNGSFNVSNGSFGSSVVKLGPPIAGAFAVSDYFTPFNFANLNIGDVDLGSGGVLLLDQPFGSPQHLLFLCGKEGRLYVIDRDNMGQFDAATDHVVQSIPGANPGAWNSPASWNGTLYLGGASEPRQNIADSVKGYAIDPVTGMLSIPPSSQTSVTFQFPAPTPSISANGTSNGIMWVLQESNFLNNTGQAVLLAFDATNLANLLYSSNQNATRDAAGLSVKFGVPTVVNGKVYVGGRNQLTVFGLLP